MCPEGLETVQCVAMKDNKSKLCLCKEMCLHSGYCVDIMPIQLHCADRFGSAISILGIVYA